MKLVELQKQRASLVKEMRAFVDGIEDKTGMTDEQSTRFDTMNADLNKMDQAIEREENLSSLEASLNEIPEDIQRPSPAGGDHSSPFASKEYVDAYDQFIRGGMNTDLRATLTIGTDSEGGYTVPETWAPVLIQKLTDNVIMRQLATVITTDNDRNLPVVTDNGSAGWVDEKATYPESDIAVGNIILAAWKLGRITKVSEELLLDSGVDIVAELARVFGMTFGTAEEASFFTGDGTKKPTGILVSAQNGKTAAAANAITYDELVDLEYSVREVYRNMATWVVKGSTAGMLRKMKSSDGIPLWQPSVQAGQPDLFNGKPLRTTEAMPAVSTGAKTVAFGDFSQYRIADRGSIYMQRLDESYANQGLIGFRIRKRVDGKLAVAESVKTLTMA